MFNFSPVRTGGLCLARKSQQLLISKKTKNKKAQQLNETKTNERHRFLSELLGPKHVSSL